MSTLNLYVTGNPFIDAGIYALRSFKSKRASIDEITKEDVKDCIDFISSLYLKDGWKKNMFGIFPNSALTNPSVKNKEEKYHEELMDLYNNIEDTAIKGNCIGCGRNAINQYNKRDIPLYGSLSLRNYSSFMCDGADYCPLCVLLIHFMPLMLYRSGGKFILLHSNSKKVMNFWSNKVHDDYYQQQLLGDYKGCFNEEYKNPVNGIFHMIGEVIRFYDRREWENEIPSLNFYYFTNYNQGPELEIYTLPNNVFRFLTYIPSDEINNWKYIVLRQYVNIKKDEDEEKYKNKPNRVYNNLLNRKSILGFFYDQHNQKVFCSWNLIKYYLREVNNMDEKRIESIRQLGDSIAEYIEKYDEKKFLTSLENADSYSNFTNILRKLMKSKVEKGDSEILCSFDDFVYNICPDFKLWKETRDLILFRLYEKLNKYLIEEE